MTARHAIAWQIPLWKPTLLGAALDGTFATRCQRAIISSKEQVELSELIFTAVWPEDWRHEYVPSNLLEFHEETLLVSCVQHYFDSGKSLDVDWYSLRRNASNGSLTYSFNHGGRLGDNYFNQWLLSVFLLWVRTADNYLQERRR